MEKNALKSCDETKNQQSSNSNHTNHAAYIEKIKKAHSCKESEGKIIAIGIDELGNTYCGYCHQKVSYPKVTEKEVEEIKKYIENERGKTT